MKSSVQDLIPLQSLSLDPTLRPGCMTCAQNLSPQGNLNGHPQLHPVIFTEPKRPTGEAHIAETGSNLQLLLS